MNKLYSIAALALVLASCAVQEDKTPIAERDEAYEFGQLMVQDSINKMDTAAESLDLLLNGSPLDNHVSLLINNNSNCDIIVRFAGDSNYNVPVRKNFRNFVVLEKGNYLVSANLCKTRYEVRKTVTESATLTLSDGK